MPQQTFTDLEYTNRRRKTKREHFLEMMNEIIPWDKWINIIKPFYYSNKKGRKPRGIEIMLRMYLMQIWFNLSDEGTEEAIYDSYAMRAFLGIDFTSEQVPDATTLLKFRRILEKNGIGEKIFDEVNANLESSGLMMRGGTIVDATIIAAPSSTKNKDGKRDPEMHQTKKGNQWYYGMKIHTGVDAGTGYVHSVTGTSANVHDICETSKLLRKDDHIVYGDSGYIGIEKRPEITEDPLLSAIEFRINKRPGKLRQTNIPDAINWEKQIEKRKSSIRSKVEHPYHIVKRIFGYAKVVYRGIEKNMNRFFALFASSNILMCARAGRTVDFCRCT